MAYEDFTTYTEVDQGSDITVDSTTKVSWVDLYTRYETGYLYKDKGAAHFNSNFTHKFEVYFSKSNLSAYTAFWMLSNRVGDFYSVVTNSEDCCCFTLFDASERLTLRVIENGSVASDHWLASGPQLDTLYFVEVVRDDDGGANSTGRYTAYIRTGSHSGALQDTLVLDSSVGEQNDFRYLYSVATYDTNNTLGYASGYTQNLDLGEGEYTYTGDLTLSLIPESDTGSHFIYIGDLTISFSPESNYGIGFYYAGDLTLSFTPESDIVSDFVCTGDIGFLLIPESDVVGSHSYTGSITFNLVLDSLYSTPIPGFDWYSGYGLVDLTFLDGNPPYYVIEGDVPITVTPSSTIEFYSEYEVTAEGGVNIAGEGVVEFETPPVYTVTATGGIILSGHGDIEHTIPDIFELVATGGVKCSGAGTIEFIDPGDTELPIFELIGSGGVRVSGTGIIEFFEPAIYEVTATGGIEIEGQGVLEFPDLPAEYDVIASGGIKINSTSIFEFFTPDTVFELVGTGGVEISGEGLLVYICPLTFEVIGDGGVEIGGEYEAYTYHTWVITGLTFELSIYSGFDFNSYSAHQGKCYGLKDDGLYILEGDTDNGEAIHTGINIGPNNFGNAGGNKLRSIRFGKRDGDDINVKVVSSTDEMHSNLSKRKKAIISRAVYGDDIDVSIADFDKLGSMEVAVVYKK